VNILIAGAGKVGYNLAKNLSVNNDVIIIDENKNALEMLKESLDIMTIQGNIKDANVYKAIDKKIDFFIVVTNNDEVNLISTIVVEGVLDVEKVIVRLTDISYISANFQEKLKIDRLVFPYRLSAASVAKLTEYPKANNVKDFPLSDYILVSLNVKSSTIFKVFEINEKEVIAIGVQRDEKFLFLRENDIIQENDLLYIFGDRQKLKHIINKIDTISPNQINNILIYDANELGIEIAKILSELDLNVKILEKDEKLATNAAHILGENVTIINSSYEDEEMMINEGLHYSDVAIAASLKDESNIIKSLQAKQLGIKKIITIHNNLNYYSLMHSLKLSTIRGPKIVAYYEIIEEIDSRFLIYERFFLGGEGKIFIRQIFKEKNITPPKEYSKVLIIRDKQIYQLDKKFSLISGDIVMEFNFSGNRKWIESL
jgi:trk system potassium uptake protein TrkA